MGFLFLTSVRGLDLLNELSALWQCVCVLLIILLMYNLVKSFCSVKLADGINTEGNFKESWSNRVSDFYSYSNEILRGNIKDQKTLLTSISRKNRRSVKILCIIILILLTNSLSNMKKLSFNGDGENPMTPEVFENGEQSGGNPMVPEKIERSGGNPMVPEKIEKSED